MAVRTKARNINSVTDLNFSVTDLEVEKAEQLYLYWLDLYREFRTRLFFDEWLQIIGDDMKKKGKGKGKKGC